MKQTLENQFTSLGKSIEAYQTKTIEKRVKELAKDYPFSIRKQRKAETNVYSLFFDIDGKSYQLYRCKNGKLKLIQTEKFPMFYYKNNASRLLELKDMYGSYRLVIGKADKTLTKFDKYIEGMIS